MQIVHPTGPSGTLPPEDVFLAVDDWGAELGRSLIVYQYQPHLYPDCPINLYFSLEGRQAAAYLLFGAAMARARQLRDMDPSVQARVYTSVDPANTQLRDFYLHNGLDCTDSEDVVRLVIPPGDGRIPMSCTVVQTPLNTPDEVNAFLQRLAQHDLGWITAEKLDALARQPHFLALGLYRNTDLIGEVLMAGHGDSCELAAIYIVPMNRRQGMARALLHRAMAVMAAEGVAYVTARRLNRSEPQRRLLADFGAESLGITAIYPGLYL